MTEERCENCKFYSELKIYKRCIKTLGGYGAVSGWTVGEHDGLWDKSHCCLMFVKTENEPYVLEVKPYDMCEMFCAK